MSDEPRIHVYAADTGGCGSYRLRWPTAAARTAGVDVHDCHGQPLGQLTVTRNRDRITTRITDPPACDIIVLQRVTRADHVAAIPTEGRDAVTTCALLVTWCITSSGAAVDSDRDDPGS